MNQQVQHSITIWNVVSIHEVMPCYQSSMLLSTTACPLKCSLIERTWNAHFLLCMTFSWNHFQLLHNHRSSWIESNLSRGSEKSRLLAQRLKKALTNACVVNIIICIFKTEANYFTRVLDCSKRHQAMISHLCTTWRLRDPTKTESTNIDCILWQGGTKDLHRFCSFATRLSPSVLMVTFKDWVPLFFWQCICDFADHLRAKLLYATELQMYRPHSWSASFLGCTQISTFRSGYCTTVTICLNRKRHLTYIFDWKVCFQMVTTSQHLGSRCCTA